MIAYSPAFAYAEAHSKNLERDKIQALARARGNFDDTMSQSIGSREDVSWWIENIRASGRQVRVRNPDLVVFTDASNEGWGAVCEGVSGGGHWSEEEMEDHIDVLELRAALFGVVRDHRQAYQSYDR